MWWCGDVVKWWCFYRNEINLGRGNIVVRYRIIDALSPKRSTKIRLFVSLIASIKLFCDFTVPFSSLTWCMRVMYLWRGFSFFLRIFVLLVFGFLCKWYCYLTYILGDTGALLIIMAIGGVNAGDSIGHRYFYICNKWEFTATITPYFFSFDAVLQIEQAMCIKPYINILFTKRTFRC